MIPQFPRYLDLALFFLKMMSWYVTQDGHELFSLLLHLLNAIDT